MHVLLEFPLNILEISLYTHPPLNRVKLKKTKTTLSLSVTFNDIPAISWPPDLQAMDISITHPQKFVYGEVIFKRILIIFAPEEAEIFKDYLFTLSWFSVRLPLFSYDLKTKKILTSNMLYILTKIKSEKSTFMFKSPENKNHADKKLLSDKQIKFQEFCASWNKIHKNLHRDSFRIFFWKKCGFIWNI